MASHSSFSGAESFAISAKVIMLLPNRPDDAPAAGLGSTRVGEGRGMGGAAGSEYRPSPVVTAEVILRSIVAAAGQ